MSKIKIGIDLDGVLWDLVKYWLDEYNEITGENVRPDDIKTYNIDKYVKYPEILFHILENGMLWNKIELYPNIYDTIKWLKENDDIEFKIVTSTYYKIVLQKFNRLFELLPMLDRSDIIVTDDKSWIDLDCLIDDYEENLINSEAPIRILLTQPYNTWFSSYKYGIYRKDDLLSAIKFCLRIKENYNI